VTAPFTTAVVGDGVLSLCVATDEDCHMDPRWSERLVQSLDAIGRDASVRVVVLEGGAHAFCAGASRAALLTRDAAPTQYAAQVARALLATPVPVVAAMAGHAIGGGLVAGLWCDAVVLGEESLYGANFMALGFTPGMGATAVVPDAFGPFLGRRLLYTGELMTGREIRSTACPLSHAVHKRAEVRDRALAIAGSMAEVPRAALVLLKQAIAGRRGDALEQALETEHRAHAALFADGRTFDEIARRYPGGDGVPGVPQ
jgi:polyketide biosynthesis enoyl-CoA hydratase PksI